MDIDVVHDCVVRVVRVITIVIGVIGVISVIGVGIFGRSFSGVTILSTEIAKLCVQEGMYILELLRYFVGEDVVWSLLVEITISRVNHLACHFSNRSRIHRITFFI
jgi:hypothetical protein